MARQCTITKAIIPAAGLDSRLMPASLAVPKALFPMACPDGCVRPVMHMIAREALAAGIEQFGVIVSPGGQERIERYFRDHSDRTRGGAADADVAEIADLADRITYITQPTAEGFGHAVWCAKDFADGQPTLVMLGDHVYLPFPGVAPVVDQVVRCFEALAPKSLLGVAAQPLAKLHLHGVVAGDPVVGGPDGLFRVRRIIEKPDVDTARNHLVTKGLAEDEYLAHCGLYAFDAEIFEVLDRMVRADDRSGGEIQLTTAQQKLLAGGGDTCALQIAGLALDMGNADALAAAQGALWAFGRANRPS